MAKIVRIFDRTAIELVNRRAAAEHRSASNAAAATVREALHVLYGVPDGAERTGAAEAGQAE